MWRPCLRYLIAKLPPPRAIRRMNVVDALVVRAIPVILRKASTARAVRASKEPGAPVT